MKNIAHQDSPILPQEIADLRHDWILRGKGRKSLVDHSNSIKAIHINKYLLQTKTLSHLQAFKNTLELNTSDSTYTNIESKATNPTTKVVSNYITSYS
ncbi:conserved hypothetical protein [Ricinus communis]|uniref:Uncharacterized protein n=1 Tax=Ricinus communis TaxID=3988 RepID=B9RSH2_RICCO|nr:conserved hypothetical protein [Ricinus communis]